jgi:hypothetical protein
MPLAIEAVRQIDAIFAAERAINGQLAPERLAVRQRDIAPLVLSRIYAAPTARLGCLAFKGQGAFASQC